MGVEAAEVEAEVVVEDGSVVALLASATCTGEVSSCAEPEVVMGFRRGLRDCASPLLLSVAQPAATPRMRGEWPRPAPRSRRSDGDAGASLVGVPGPAVGENTTPRRLAAPGDPATPAVPASPKEGLLPLPRLPCSRVPARDLGRAASSRWWLAVGGDALRHDTTLLMEPLLAPQVALL